MKKVVIIPARYNSSRLPGKPLLDIAGKPMIVRVCNAMTQSQFDQMVVATDDQRIHDAVRTAGFDVVMTSRKHVSGTDRLQEAAEQLSLSSEDIVINVQGDEPLMALENVHQVADLLEKTPSASVATLFETQLACLNQPNLVKLVTDNTGRVLYFSRADIPWLRDSDNAQPLFFKIHMGLYAYRKSALDRFISYPEADLECLEKLEQLRFMVNGENIVAHQAKVKASSGVDTQADLDRVRALFGDQL